MDKHNKFEKARFVAACTVFEGKVVVSGGYYDNSYFDGFNEDSDDGDLKSVESCNYYENKWTYLPDMIEERDLHASVSMGNKIFVIGGFSTSNCEVFDSTSKKFTSIKCLKKTCHGSFQAVCLDNILVVFNIPINSGKGQIYVYDTESNEYLAVNGKISEKLVGVSCVKYYTC